MLFFLFVLMCLGCLDVPAEFHRNGFPFGPEGVKKPILAELDVDLVYCKTAHNGSMQSVSHEQRSNGAR
jgi:hypothetical protein